ncbi:MAG: type VI secretion system contractile sheath large subunit [Pseudomonadota bacterium]
MIAAAPAYAGALIDETVEDGARRRAFAARVDRLIARLDEALAEQVSAIIHAPAFQAMEARWRGLESLLEASTGARDVVVRILDVDWRTVSRDLERAADFDRSTLFRLVHEEEFGSPGGQPFGLILGDYAVSHRADRDRGDQVEVLRRLASVAASCFCPFVMASAPDAFDLEGFDELSGLSDLDTATRTLELQRWQALRAQEDTRFIGLVAPRVLLRPAHAAGDRTRADGFVYAEPRGRPLWGNGAFAFGAVVIAAFRESGWFAEIRGARQDAPDGGAVDSFAPHDFRTDRHGLSAQPPLEVRLTPAQEQQMADHGVIPLVAIHLSSTPVFNTNPSLHRPPKFDSPTAEQNARLGAMLQYVLCASRFAHYLRVIMRDEVGSIADEAMLQRKLDDWLSQYCLGNEDAELDLRARYPLRSAGVSVRAVPGRAGVYACTIHLQPHFQLDHVSTSFQLVAEAAETMRNAG